MILRGTDHLPMPLSRVEIATVSSGSQGFLVTCYRHRRFVLAVFWWIEFIAMEWLKDEISLGIVPISFSDC